MSVVSHIRNNYILTSIAASLGIVIPLLFFTGRVNLLSTLSNMVITPVVPLVMIYGFLSSLLYSITSRKFLTLPQEWLVQRIYTISDLTNTYALTLSVATWRGRMSLSCLVIIIVSLLMVAHKKNTSHNKS